MEKHFKFINRKQELSKLKTIIDSTRPTIGVIYGRRRIGKSVLVKKAFEGKKFLIFEGLENRTKHHQVQNFIFQLVYQTKCEDIRTKVTTWNEAFFSLYEFVKSKPHHILFDEFQWMANYRKEIVSELKPVWDQYFSTINGITLILCGSIASFMTTKVIKSNALYGRVDLELHVKSFKITETKEMLPNRGIQEIIEAHMFTGGIPQYLNLLKEKPSIRIGIEELGFFESGYFFSEYNKIFTSHFGKNPMYEKIINVLSQYPYGLFRKQLAEKSGIKAGGLLTDHLKNLEAAGFISSQIPFHKDYNSRLIKYFLSDAYLRLYFSFIKPNIKKIRSGIQKNIFTRISQSGAFYSWLGRAFEYFCIQHAGKIAELLGFSGIDFTCGPYFKPHSKEKSGVQIDLLFSRADNVITLCEMKYSNNSIGIGIIKEVESKVEIVKRDFPKKTIQRVLIIQSDPTKELVGSGYFYRIIKVGEFV